MTIAEQYAAITASVVNDALDTLREEQRLRDRDDMVLDARARLDEWVSHAIERGPTVAAWVTGRAALARVR